jgi:hypothetical protein
LALSLSEGSLGCPKKAQPDLQLYAEDRGPGQEVKAS